MQSPFIWDSYSDQPYPIKDKKYKAKKRGENLIANLKLIVTNLIFFPISLLLAPFFKANSVDNEHFYAMGVDIDKGNAQPSLIDELGIKHLLIRLPLWQMERIDEFVQFAKSFGTDKKILINILQDREHIEDPNLLIKDIEIIFDKFGPFVQEFQIGNAINRTKWGFFSIDEYLKWYQTIQAYANSHYPHIKLIGSSIIDFEFHYTIRSLFNFFHIKYDRFSSLLYVDRRGAPSNKQLLIFDTKNKINLLYSMVKLSPKTSNQIYITEVNWPLQDTAPYAPTSQKECVSYDDYSTYMQEYHKIALASHKITRVYWHQLIAPGYGLVDNRNGLHKTPAFYAYQKMIQNSKDSSCK